MELQKIINEFLGVIDFKLCSIDDNSITIQDIRNTDELNTMLVLPIDYISNDDLRVFRSSKITSNSYFINVLNTKYPKIPFSKNGIKSFNTSIKKDNDNDYFSSELYHNDSLFFTFVGNVCGCNNLSYRKCDSSEIINIFYGLDNNNRSLEISSHIFPRTERKLYIREYNNNDQHSAILVVKENDQEVYKKEIEAKEIDNYLQSLAHKLKNIIEPANNGIKTLNNNIFEMVFNYYNIATQFLDIFNQSVSSNEVIDILFEKYFSTTILKKQNEIEIPYQKKLTLTDLRKSN